MYHVGLDLGGTMLKAAVVDDVGAVHYRISTPTRPERGVEACCRDLLALIDKCCTQAQISDIGLAVAGTEDEAGVITNANNLPIGGIPLGTSLRSHLSVPLLVENDANAAAWGEYLLGGYHPQQSLLMLTLGTGIGGGFIYSGKLLRGAHGGAGEVGHMVIHQNGELCTCGRRGCFETYASTSVLVRCLESAIRDNPHGLLAKLSRKVGIQGEVIFAAYRQSDPDATLLLDRFWDNLACGVANLIYCFQPDAVCIGGGISAQGEALLSPLRARVCLQMNLPLDQLPRIYASKLQNDAGVIGAALLGKMGT